MLWAPPIDDKVKSSRCTCPDPEPVLVTVILKEPGEMPYSGAEVLPKRCPGDPTVVYHPSSLRDTRFATVTVATEVFWGNKEGRPLLSSQARIPAQPLHAPAHTESPQLRKAWLGCCDPTNLPNFRKPLSIDGFTVYTPLLLKLDLRQDPLKLRLHS